MDERLDFDHPLWDKSNVATFKYCRFHRNPNHNRDDYVHVKHTIEDLIQGGKMKRFTLKWNDAGYQENIRYKEK